jgi:hypothetical protein
MEGAGIDLGHGTERFANVSVGSWAAVLKTRADCPQHFQYPTNCCVAARPLFKCQSRSENIGRMLPPNLPKDVNDGESHIRLPISGAIGINQRSED